MENQVTRRQFLQTGTAAVAGGMALGKPSGENVKPSSATYESEIPDTLDLAERGALAINALTGAACPEHGYETCLGGHFDQRPPYLSLRLNGSCEQKPVHALPMMRVMSGSTLNHEYDGRMMEAIVRDIDDHGLWWIKLEGRPWRAMYKGDFVYTRASGRFMVALADWYRYDRDPRWLSILDRMGHGLSSIAVQQGDNTMYYSNFYRSGWPASPGVNPSILDNGPALRGFAAWYAATGDKKALEMAEKLARLVQGPAVGTWKPSEGQTMVAASERAHWEGHFHTHTRTMMGLIEYANQVNDMQAKRFVANFYEYTRNFGISRMGFFPSVVRPLERIYFDQAHENPKGMPDDRMEGCAVADMTLLAILLSDGGMGDYWEDVDQYVRNHLIEHQIVRRDLLEAIVAAAPEHELDPQTEIGDRVIDRQLGAFISCSDPTMSYAWWTMCCLANCSVAMYKAWESIVRFQDGVAQVNLLLNRASAALDIDSYLPYEGKAVLKNKLARKAFVRVPAWADKSAVKCRVNERQIPPHWLNNYLVLDRLSPKEVVTIEFPIVDATEEHNEPAYRQQYACRFRGNTLVDISPRANRPHRTRDASDDGSKFGVIKGYPLYLRESYKGNKAPMKKVQRYVSATII